MVNLSVSGSSNVPILYKNWNTPIYLEKEEVMRFLNTIPATSARDRVLFFTLWGTGLRITEALRLRKGNLNIPFRQVKVTWLKKRKQAERILTLHRDVILQLAGYSANLGYDDKIFNITRQQAGRLCRKYAKAANIEKNVHPHTFRHSFAVNFIRQTRDLVTLSKLLGHSSVNNTMIYLQFMQKDIADRLDEVSLV